MRHDSFDLPTFLSRKDLCVNLWASGISDDFLIKFLCQKVYRITISDFNDMSFIFHFEENKHAGVLKIEIVAMLQTDRNFHFII